MKQNMIIDKQYSGFSVRALKTLPEFDAQGVYCIHDETGCEVFHLYNDDRENLFSFTFRTPPADSTGIAHILEHSVLCGSQVFPIKDPFVVLLRSSLNTFLNAFTFPDKTVYPASSQVEQDFFNLLQVYGDAVFNPLLNKEVFMQEGHHLEWEQDVLTRVGVVFNEMKGAYSSPDGLLASWSLRAIFPDTPYGFESGGDPKVMPSLTYEQFKKFHSDYYHPSNCRIFLYGNIPTDRTLDFLQDHFLGSFKRSPVDSELTLQPRWDSPRLLEKSFPVRQSEDRARSSVLLNWLTLPITDPLDLLSMSVLTEILLGNVGSPLQKALLESGLGEDISPATGLESETREVVFSVGLRGTDRSQKDQIESLVLDTLQKLADRGIPEELVKGAVHQVEFRNREIRRGGRPFSLQLMRRSLRGWLHGLDPWTTLEFAPIMEQLKSRLEKNDGYLERVLREQLVENPHRLTLLMEPDPEQEQRDMDEERSSLKSVQDALGESELQQIQTDLDLLREFQDRPDSPEDLNRIPTLNLADLPVEVERIPTVLEAFSVPLLFHDLYTNGVVYLDLAFDTTGIDEDLLPLIPLLGRSMCGSGLPGKSYDQVARELSLVSGGFSASPSASLAIEGRLQQHLGFRVKMLDHHLPEALPLIFDLLQQATLNDLDRLGTLLMENRNDLKASLIPGGHQYVALRAGSHLSPALSLEERWRGLSQVRVLHDMDEDKLPELARDLSRLREALITRDRLLLNLTTERPVLDQARKTIGGLIENIPQSRAETMDSPFQISGDDEAWSISAGVGYVARSLPAARFGTRQQVQETVLAQHLRTGYLWHRIRMKGGAYGAFAMSNGLEGVFTFASYRDPEVEATLEAFRDALVEAKDAPVSSDEMLRTLIGAVGADERPLAPGEKGYVGLRRHILGISDTLRQQHRDQLLGIKAADLSEAADRLLAAFDRGVSVVMSNRQKLDNSRWAENLKILDVPE